MQFINGTYQMNTTIANTEISTDQVHDIPLLSGNLVKQL